MLALGCGLVASIGITQVMAKRNAAPASNSTEMDAIFVAMQDIPMGEPVTAQMVKLEEWPKDKIPPGALGKIEDVENRRTKTKIYQGSPVLGNLLLSAGASELTASGQIPKGYRVVPVRVDNVSGGGNMIRPMDRVDVLVHLTRNVAKEVSETTTRTILQDVRVFAINDVYDLDTTDSASKIVAQTISLLVPLDQAEKVILAEELGEIRLVMRSADDTDEVVTGGARPSELFGPTESGDRDKESVLASPKPLQTPPPSDDFLRFLNAQQTDPPSAPPLPDPKECWTMRTIYGSEVSEVVLELGADQATPEGKQSSFPLWKKILSSVRPGPDTAAAAEPAVKAAEPEPEKSAPTDDKKDEEESQQDD
jgi:pilus assembly protein CpaB